MNLCIQEAETEADQTEHLPERAHLEAELHKAQVALVVIVQELEGRLREQDQQLSDKDELLSLSKEDNKDMLEFFRKRAPAAEKLWQEACVCKNANTQKRRSQMGKASQRHS